MTILSAPNAGGTKLPARPTRTLIVRSANAGTSGMTLFIVKADLHMPFTAAYPQVGGGSGSGTASAYPTSG